MTRSFPDTGLEKWGYTPNISGATSYTNQLNNVTLFAYDSLRRKTTETSVGVTTNSFTYSGAGDLLTLTDGRNQVTTWHYDTFGRVTNKVDAAGEVDFVYQYDAGNRVTNRWTPAKGNTAYAYDAMGNRTGISYGGASSISFAYDPLNRLTNMEDGLGTTRFTYNTIGQMLSAGGLWSGDTVKYTYANRLRTALTLGTWTNNYAYDSQRRLTSLNSPAGAFSYQFLTPNSPLPTSISVPNGANIVNSYDALARLQSTVLNNHWGHTLDGYTYGVNPLGFRTNIVRNLGLTGSTVSASYDAIGQVTSWQAVETNGVARHNEQLGYVYDAAGNLQQRSNDDLTQTFTMDAANGLTNISRTSTFTLSGATPAPATNLTVNGLVAERYGDFTFARTNLTLANGSNTFTNLAQNLYGVRATNILTLNLPASITLQLDANGNLTNDGLRSMAYDAENQLTNLIVAGSFKKDFVYDGLNRLRIKREFKWDDGTSGWIKTNEIRLVWDDNVIVQIRDSNNVPTLTLTRGLDLSGSLQGAGGIGGLLAMTASNGASYFYHSDGSGNVTALMDAQENVTARRMYDAFGRTLRLTGDKAGLNPFWFSSQLHDEQTDFYHYKHRVYAPAWQRFLNRDPIGERGGKNLYAYCQNNPVCLLDLMGLCPDDSWWSDWESWEEALLTSFEQAGDQLGYKGVSS